MQSGASVMLADAEPFGKQKKCRTKIAQNLNIQIERAEFSPTRHILRRRLVASNVKFCCFKRCKPTQTGC